MKTKLLFVDDDPDIILTIKMILSSEYDLTAMNDPLEALSIIESEDDFGVVVSDYRMPSMNGIDFLIKIKELMPNAVRIIITSSDDMRIAIKAVNETNIFRFITKPFDYDLLLGSLEEAATLNKIITSEKELTKRLQEALETIKYDLKAASQLQRSLLPKKNVDILGIEFISVFNPSVLVSGDMFNYFMLDENTVGFYLIDVAGHGFSSAMLSVALSSYITADIQKESPLKEYNPETNNYEVLSPSVVISKLNERFLTRGNSIDYFTMIYGVINTLHNKLSICHAGHPPSYMIDPTGIVERIYCPNYPVAVLGKVQYKQQVFDFRPGSKLFVYSDGLIECRNANSNVFSEKKLEGILSKNNGMPAKKTLSKISQELFHWRGNNDFDDDVTFFILERTK